MGGFDVRRSSDCGVKLLSIKECRPRRLISLSAIFAGKAQ